MNKYPVYPGAIPLDINVLQPQRATEIALGFLMQAAFGAGTVIDGLAVTQTVSPSMGVLVGPGAIIVATTVDTVVAGFGSLAVDVNPLVKIGINLTPTTLTTLTAPGTAGQSQNTLVEAQFLEVDGSPVVLPYYNSANPSIPFTGPSNAGTPNNTARTNTVQLQYKQGAAAATGSQLTPAPDAGWVGVAVITIANGQSSVLNANITPYPNAPVIPTKLPNLRIKLTSNLNLYVSPTGNDLNSGVAASVPFATLQKAWNTIVSGYDMNGFTATVNVANGTYTSGVIINGPAVGQIDALSSTGDFPTVVFLGNVVSPSSVLISSSTSNAFSIMNGARVGLSGFKVAASQTGQYAGNGALCTNGGYCVLAGPMDFGACGFAHIQAAQGSTLSGTTNPYTISGNSPAHYVATQSSNLLFSGSTVTLTGTPAFSTGFAYVTTNSTIVATSMTWTGAGSGSRYTITTNGVIVTGGGGLSYFLPSGGSVGSPASPSTQQYA